MKYFLPLLCLLLSGCQMRAPEPIAQPEYVELERFMGDWYVIASIATVFERGAHNAVESYALRDDGRVDTTFTFNRGGFDGPQRRMTPVARVREGSGNATWGMQFVWPFHADFRILLVADDYSHTIIGRKKRDYVWIMAREPVMDPAIYDSLIRFLDQEGYDINQIETVPQCWTPDCVS